MNEIIPIAIIFVGAMVLLFWPEFNVRFRVKTIVVNDGIGNKYYAQVRLKWHQGWLTIGRDTVGDGRSGSFVFRLRANDSMINGYDTYEGARALCREYKNHLSVLDKPTIKYEEVCDED